jgi:hypothetical protein
VTYNIIADPLSISQAQFDALNNKWANATYFAGGHGNNRNVQALNSRTIYFYQAAESTASYIAAISSMSVILSIISFL